jgi:hypothetical protein
VLTLQEMTETLDLRAPVTSDYERVKSVKAMKHKHQETAEFGQKDDVELNRVIEERNEWQAKC